MNTTPHIAFGDDPNPTPPPAQVVGHGRSVMVSAPSPIRGHTPTALKSIEDVLAGLETAEIVELLEAIKAKIDQVSAAADQPAPAVSEPDAMDRANQLRRDAAHELEEMAWVNGFGDRIPLKLTSYKYSQYERLRRLRRGFDAPPLVSENEAIANRYVDAGLLLYLCSPGLVSFINEGAPIVLQLAAEWMDHHIPLGRQDAALRVANRLLDLTDLFVPVERKSLDDEESADDEDEEVAQKKTLPQDGSPDTSLSSASR